MSTHIEHGSRVRVKSIAELNARVLEFRRQVQAVARQSYQRKAAQLAYQILDEARLQPTPEAFLTAVRQAYATSPIEHAQSLTETDLRWVVRHIIADHQATMARTQERDPEFDWGCHLSAIPHRTGLYVLLYAEQEAYHAIWQSLPGVQEYAYWDHTDPPEGMSQTRWERRRQRWDELLGHDAPSKSGMTLAIYDPLTDGENRFWDVKPEFVPNFDARVRHWAFTHAVEEIWHAESPEERGFQTVFRTRRWIKTPEGAPRWEELQQAVREVIPVIWDNDWLHRSLGTIWETVRWDRSLPRSEP